MTEAERVFAEIDREELARIAVDLGDIYSPPGQEKEVGAYVERWLKQEGFETRVVAITPERPNVVGTLRGAGGGYSLAFNSHMDVAPATPVFFRDPMRRGLRHAWREGDLLRGMGVVNDKGPLACFLIAAKAIKKAGVVLRGDVVVTGVSGEIGYEPVDEFGPPEYLSKEVGARYMVNHGVIADYALVAEATAFKLGWVEAGKAFFKISVYNDRPLYTPYVSRPYELAKNPNAIVKTAALVNRIEEWALEYEKKHRYECDGGVLIPRVSIGAIRGGAPYRPTNTPEVCSIYVDCRITPGQDVPALKEELERLLSGMGLDGSVELYVFRAGFEMKNGERLVDAIGGAHRRVFGEAPAKVVGPEVSMWRDTNIFNEVGIPSATYGPGGGAGGGNLALELDDCVKAAQVYALTALEICRQEKKPR
jgi:acetylornithine deacetylase/succinyl-diaminopimelate desuccinylase-like protein